MFSVIDTAADTVTATILAGAFICRVAVSRDGTKEYVINSGSNTVSVTNTTTNTVMDRADIGIYPSGPGQSLVLFRDPEQKP